MPAAPNMNIKTDTDLVKKAREGVMEFLLVSDVQHLSHGCPVHLKHLKHWLQYVPELSIISWITVLFMMLLLMIVS